MMLSSLMIGCDSIIISRYSAYTFMMVNFHLLGNPRVQEN